MPKVYLTEADRQEERLRKLHERIADNYYIRLGRNRGFKGDMASKLNISLTTIYRMMDNFEEFKKIGFDNVCKIAKEVGIDILKQEEK